MKQTSGLDALLEALKQSGFNTDGVGGAGRGGSADSEPIDVDGSSAGGRGSSRKGPGGPGGGVPNIDFSFVENFHGPKSKKALIVAIILVILILAAAYWWFHPPINIHSADTWAVILIFIALPLFVFFASKRQAYRKGNDKVEKSPSKAKRFKGLMVIPVAIVLVAVVGGVLSLPIFPGNAERYSNVLQTDTLDFAEDIQEVNYSEVPVIDRDSAILLGNREMGAIPEYVSQFEISPMYSQINYQGTPVRVSPLGYADLFKWFTNREGGIPAYSLVDMTTQNAQIVRLDDNPIYYSQSEPLARNIDRYVQLKYPFYMFGEKSFEIDEEGQPWWICPVKEFTIGLFGGETIGRAVLVNATTGECQDLAVSDVPEWVDRVFPAELLIEQYNWYGSYHNGWFNSFLGQEGVVRTTPGTDGAAGYNYIAKDDDVWVYTGVTSATADKSIVGFVLVNQRTQESHFYSVPGATEDSAMLSAEGQVQNLRYTATFPILINVANQPTYFMALKDGAGLVKMFAMVDIQRYQNVAVGNTVAETQEAYEALLATNGIAVDESLPESQLTASGAIRSIAQAVIDGNSHFYVTLDGTEGIFDFALPNMLGIVGYRTGDLISLAYSEAAGVNTVTAILDTEGNKLGVDGKPLEYGVNDGETVKNETVGPDDSATADVSSQTADAETGQAA